MATQVEAQIAGSVWKIERAVGDVVKEEDVLMILESMKMEIPGRGALRRAASARSGSRRAQAIEEGAVLAVIE